MESTVKTRVLIISDTHGAPLSKKGGKGKPIYPPFKAPLPAADLLIHCGDLTNSGLMEQYEDALDMLKEINAPVKLVIAGNRDLSLDKEFMVDNIGKNLSWMRSVRSKEDANAIVNQARDLWLAPNGRAVMEGVTYLEEGIHQIDLPNGARVNVYASPYTTAFHHFAFAYDKLEDRFNPPEVSFSNARNVAKFPVPSFSDSDSPIDFFVTHGPPYCNLDESARGDHVGCPHLMKAFMRCRPLVCCFGHIHEAWGAQRLRWSETVDESITKAQSTASWMQKGWRAGLLDSSDAVEAVAADLNLAKKEHAVSLDLSASLGNALRRGEETMLINASVMDLRNNPKQSPWLLDIDLPRAKQTLDES